MIATEPCEFLLWASLKGGTYQMSKAYMRAGPATVLYSCQALGGGRPVVFANHQSCCVHLVAFTVTLLVWALQLSFGSKVTPKYLYVSTLVIICGVIVP